MTTIRVDQPAVDSRHPQEPTLQTHVAAGVANAARADAVTVLDSVWRTIGISGEEPLCVVVSAVAASLGVRAASVHTERAVHDEKAAARVKDRVALVEQYFAVAK